MWKKIICFLFGHDLHQMTATIEHFNDEGMRILLESDLDCVRCGYKITVTTDCSGKHAHA